MVSARRAVRRGTETLAPSTSRLTPVARQVELRAVELQRSAAPKLDLASGERQPPGDVERQTRSAPPLCNANPARRTAETLAPHEPAYAGRSQLLRTGAN